MKESLIEGLYSAVCASYYDTRRDPVCRIFVPGDGRMFNKFEKVLRRTVTAGWQEFLREYEKEAVKLAESGWLHRYLQYQEVVSNLYDYALEREQNYRSDRRSQKRTEESEFLKTMVERSRHYAYECGSGTSGKEGGTVSAEGKILTAAEGQALRGLYGMVIQSIENTIREITPKLKGSCCFAENEAESEREKMTDAQVLENLFSKRMENEELWWHIRYCIDHGILGCEDLMTGIARNGRWKAWVRQTAVEYVCRFMEVGEICERLLPALHGKLFYWAVARLAGTQDERLKRHLKRYAECYTGQEILQDICLAKMQDREGVQRIRRYLEKRRRMPRRLENPDLLLAIGEITEAELLDEMGYLLDLMMRDSFRDRSQYGLQVSLVRALSSVAMSGKAAEEAVWELLEKKQTAVTRMAEDIRWRTAHATRADNR